MNWEETLNKYEEGKDWNNAINFMMSKIAENDNNKWLYIQSIYLFHNILLEEDYPIEKQKHLEMLLLQYFEQSQIKFAENAEYLFFIGKILYIGPWYFGLNDDTTALNFQKKAWELDPNNRLYEWAYRYSLMGTAQEDELAYQIISKNNFAIEYLHSKGFAGNYILNHLRMSSARFCTSNNLI